MRRVECMLPNHYSGVQRDCSQKNDPRHVKKKINIWQSDFLFFTLFFKTECCTRGLDFLWKNIHCHQVVNQSSVYNSRLSTIKRIGKNILIRLEFCFCSCQGPQLRVFLFIDLWVQAFRKSREPGVDKLKRPVLDEITNSLVLRYGLNFTRQDTSSLWFLCKQVTVIFPKSLDV